MTHGISFCLALGLSVVSSHAYAQHPKAAPQPEGAAVAPVTPAPHHTKPNHDPAAATAPATTGTAEVITSTEAIYPHILPKSSPCPLPGTATGVAVEHGLITEISEILSDTSPAARANHTRELAKLYGTDARTCPALLYIAENDDNAEVSEAAMKALAELHGSAQHHPAYALAQLALFSNQRGVRLRAVKVLGDMEDPVAGEVLHALAIDTKQSNDLRRHAISSLKTHYPTIIKRNDIPELTGEYWLPVVGGALAGGYTLYSAGLYSPRSSGPIVGAIAGAALGGAAGFALSDKLTMRQSALLMSAMGWGIYEGNIATRAIVNHPKYNTAVAGGVLGQAIAIGSAALAMNALDYRLGDLATINLAGIAATNAAAGIVRLAMHDEHDTRGKHGIILGAGLLGVGVAGAVSKRLHFTVNDQFLLGFGAIEGAILGSFVPRLFDSKDLVGGIQAGSAVGFLVAGAVSQFVEITPRTSGTMLAMSFYGELLGAGVPLWIRSTRPVAYAGGVIAGSVGLVAGALLAPKLKYDGGDLVLMPMATVLGLTHGLGIGLAALQKDIFASTDQMIGFSLGAAGLAGAGSMILSQWLDVSAESMALATSGIFWGGWMGAWWGKQAGWDFTKIIRTTMISMDVGLATSVILSLPWLHVDPWVPRGANLGGVAGAGLGSLLAAMGTRDSDKIMQANVYGSAAGLLLGGALGAAWAYSRPPQQRALSKDSVQTSQTGSSLWWNRFRGFSVSPYITPRGQMDGTIFVAEFDPI